MSVSFKCKVSGNVITFEQEVDIITTRENPAYEEIKDRKGTMNAEGIFVKEQ